MGYNRLAGGYVYDSVEIFYPERALQDNRELIEFRSLSGLQPAARAVHLGYTGQRGL